MNAIQCFRMAQLQPRHTDVLITNCRKCWDALFGGPEARPSERATLFIGLLKLETANHSPDTALPVVTKAILP